MTARSIALRAMAVMMVAGSSAIGLAGCSADAGADRDDARASDGEEVVEIKEYVSKTPGAKVYMQPAPDPNIVLRAEGMRGGGVYIDTVTGDRVRAQTADRERRNTYYAYSTKK